MIRIITDSSTLYTREEAEKLGFDALPLCVTILGKTYREFDEIDSIKFNELIKQGGIPTSSQPPVGEYLDLFDKYKNDEIIVICMADGLSGTYQSCVGAKETTGRDNIVVINSKTLCIPQRLMVNKAVKMRNEGATFNEIIDEVKKLADSAISYLIPQDFGFLKRGGRLTPIAATLGGLLKIKPVVTQTPDGTKLEKFTTARNFEIAVNRILDDLKERGIDNKYYFCVSHAFVEEQANKVVEKIKKKFDISKVELANLSPAFITQGGPLCLAIQVILK